MFKRIGLSLLSGICSLCAFSQYTVGTGVHTIEPDTTVFSVALGGYGAPREGRFSLTWQLVRKIQPVKAVTCLDGKFYAINANGELIAGSGNDTWKTIGNSNELSAIASGNGKIYAVSSSNELMVAKAGIEFTGWKTTGKTGYTIALGFADNKLYGINDQQQVFVIEQPDTSPAVNIIGDAPNTISLAAKGNELYALRSDNTIWKTKTGSDKLNWIKIARENGFSYTVGIKHIGIADGRAFGVDGAGNLYLAAHNSRGDLSARTLTVKTGNKTAVIVSVDLVGIKYNVVNEIKDSIFRTRKIPHENILVNISHTHFVPVTQDWPTWQPFNQEADSNYLYNIVKSGIIKSIEKALDNMKPASLYFGRGKTSIGHNRSSENNETPYDDDVDVIKVKYGASSQDILLLTGCHPVFPADNGKTYMISANYPGVARRVLEEKKIAGTAFFLQGCAGDINPREQSDVQTGMNLALDAMSVLQGDMKKVSGNISCFLDTINVPVEPMTQDEIIKFKNRFLNREGDVYAEKNVRWADMMIEKYKKGNIASALPVYVQTLNIGSWKLVGLSREVVTEYGLGIKKLWPGKLVSVAGYCNDISSYLPAESHVLRHTYEGDDSSLWYGETALFPPNVLEIVLQQIKQKGR